MTQKELLYVEDAIMHEKNIMDILNKSIQNINDEKIISFFENELDCHEKTKEKLINLLKEKINE